MKEIIVVGRKLKERVCVLLILMTKNEQKRKEKKKGFTKIVKEELKEEKVELNLYLSY